MAVTTTGGDKLAGIASTIKREKLKSYNVGFFSDAAYEDGTTVADVALRHEFGIGQPERPFFRQANKIAEKKLPSLVRKLRDPVTKSLTVTDVSKIALAHVGIVQTRITELKNPVNAPSTIAAKGSSNPLIDTGLMRSSVTWEAGDGS